MTTDDSTLSADRQTLVDRQRAALLDGELLADALAPPEHAPRRSNEEIDAKYERGEIRIVTEQARYPLGSIADLLASGDYKLDPDYQRRHRWKLQQRSRLIESFIMNVPVPPVFLYEWDYGQYEVMDGLQRLTAVRDFYSNAFPLQGLEYWTELDGMRYRALPSRIRAGIDRRYLSSIVLLKETSHGEETPERLKRFVFGRINTGGVQLSPQELRNALYDGPMNQLCKELAETPALRRMWGIPEDVEEIVERAAAATEPELGLVDDYDDSSDPIDVQAPAAWRDMTDVELVLRFFANRQRMVAYRDNIRDYLDEYLQVANRYDRSAIGALRALFLDTLALAEELFGEFAFRRPRGDRWGNVPSKSIYDALMNVLSRLLGSKDDLLANRGSIMDGLMPFYESNSRVFNLRGQTRSDVMTREVLLERYFRTFLSES